MERKHFRTYACLLLKGEKNECMLIVKDSGRVCLFVCLSVCLSFSLCVCVCVGVCVSLRARVCARAELYLHGLSRLASAGKSDRGQEKEEKEEKEEKNLEESLGDVLAKSDTHTPLARHQPLIRTGVTPVPTRHRQCCQALFVQMPYMYMPYMYMPYMYMPYMYMPYMYTLHVCGPYMMPYMYTLPVCLTYKATSKAYRSGIHPSKDLLAHVSARRKGCAWLVMRRTADVCVCVCVCVGTKAFRS
jgi:hypothetical protein